MMRQVFYKYKLKVNISGPQIVQMPKGARIMRVHNQYGEICMWAVHCTNEEEKEDRIFRVYGTGHEIPQSAEGKANSYIGTVFQGHFVWHILEYITDNNSLSGIMQGMFRG